MIHLEQFVYARPNLLALMAHVGRFVYPSRQTHEINIRLIKSQTHLKKLDKTRGFHEVENLIFKDNQHMMGKVVNPTHWSPLPLGKYFCSLFLVEPRTIARSEGFMLMKILMKQSVIEFVTYWNQWRYYFSFYTRFDTVAIMIVM
jgi:hypothetical protein